MTSRFKRWMFFGLIVASCARADAQANMATECTPKAQKLLSSLTPEGTPRTILQFSKYEGSLIKSVQTCLAQQGCYDSNPATIDGTVGKFTQDALYKLAYAQCSPSPEPAPCGTDTDVVSWRLTANDISALKLEHQDANTDSTGTEGDPASNDDTGKQQSAVAQANSGSGDAAQVSGSPLGSGTVAKLSTIAPGPSGTSEQSIGTDAKLDEMQNPSPWSDVVKGIDSMQDLAYPSSYLFENALEFFVDQKTQRDHKALLAEVKAYEHEIVSKACKALDPGRAVPELKPDWRANMVYSLSDQVYAFYPTGLIDDTPSSGTQGLTQPKPIRVDFGVLGEIGWVGATFTESGGVKLQPMLQHVNGGISKQIELARRFRTDVDLVVYKSQSAAAWAEFASGKSSERNAIELAAQISDEVTRRNNTLLNTIQYWAMPELTMRATAWDGVTLDFANYPFDDPAAVKYLVRLITGIRNNLNKASQRETVWTSQLQSFSLNLVVPYAAFVSHYECNNAEPVSSVQPDRALMQLAGLVPRDRSDSGLRNNGPGSTASIINNFIVFLPQPTTCTKKALRQAIESAFDRSAENVELLKQNPSLSLAEWRYQMLRRVIYTLSPNTWGYTGPDYTLPGSQFYDDLVYARDNFGGIALSSLPFYVSESSALPRPDNGLALAIHKIFRLPGTPNFGEAIPLRPGTPQRWPLAVYIANFCGAWRRELALIVEILLGLLLGYSVASYWILELRSFFTAHRVWFVLALIVAIVLIMMLCQFDRRVRAVASLIYVVLTFAGLIALWIWQYVTSSVERDLP